MMPPHAQAYLGLKLERRDLQHILQQIDKEDKPDGKVSFNEFQTACNAWIKEGKTGPHSHHHDVSLAAVCCCVLLCAAVCCWAVLLVAGELSCAVVVLVRCGAG
jgi:hypothetical protein